MTKNITDLYPVDESGNKFDPLKHNILNNTALPQLSTSGNFYKVRESDPNSPELIERFHAHLLKDAGQSQDDVTTALGGIINNDTIPASLAEEVAEQNQEATESAANIDFEDIPSELIVEEAQESDSDTIMDGPEKQGNIAEEYKGDINLEVILQTCEAARKTGSIPNFSNGGDRQNNYEGKGYSMQRINLAGRDLRGAVFNNCDLRNADFTGANCEGARFLNSKLEGANFHEANLRFAILPKHFKEQAMYDNELQVKQSYYEGTF